MTKPMTLLGRKAHVLTEFLKVIRDSGIIGIVDMNGDESNSYDVGGLSQQLAGISEEISSPIQSDVRLIERRYERERDKTLRLIETLDEMAATSRGVPSLTYSAGAATKTDVYYRLDPCWLRHLL
jgi:hypothetical protein